MSTVEGKPNEPEDVAEKGLGNSLDDGPEIPDKKEELTQTVTAQDWSGPDDPENPHNWPMWLRIYHTIAPGLFAFAVTLGSSIYAPGFPEVEKKFNVSSTVAILPISLYALGLAFGPVMAAPVSETMGRRVVYLVTTPIAMLFILGAGFSNTFAALAICRLFAGIFGSPVLAVGAGTNADIWPPVHRAVATSTFLLAPFLGSTMGPVIGGYAAQNKGWRWTQWPLLFFLLPLYLSSLFMKETYKKIILQKRAKRLGIPPPPQMGPAGFAAIKFLVTVTLFRPIRMIFTEPIVFFFSMYTGFNFSVLFGFFDAFPIVFQGVYGFDTGASGLTFLGLAFGCCVGVVTCLIVNRLLYYTEFLKSHKEGRNGAVAPEHRLYAAMMGSFGIPIGLFWFAWTSRRSVHWISPVLAAVPFGWGNICVFTSAALYLIDVYGPLNGASALAANGLIRYIAGAVFPLFTVQMYDRLGIAWATSLFGFLSLLMLPIPWVLFKFGPQIRRKSKYDTMKA
ncbi:MAG: hypothetical protein ALECFALPRED_002885 [Alectoria fallacina]|uniref:Major facilitator superfamily (MFS) profile domain-containing protein n=1 Tax=Alectoria fallacina TaxID=1903189 RepID=A0A8H3ISX9_9LECA|nr:MAG: hypothetical protein ALECFALPRED_002885 [Alectoria fallacina]